MNMTPRTHLPSARLQRILVSLAALALIAPGPVSATVPPGSGFTETLVAGGPSPNGLLNPTAMAFAPDGRLFVAQQGGALRVVNPNAVLPLLPTPFVTLTVDSGGERGLLGVAFDPSFSTNGYVYVYYTVPSSVGPPAVTLHNRVSRFTAPIDGTTGLPGNTAPLSSEVAILDLEALAANNHNGGAIHFGPDGKLYVAVGENGNAPNSQSLGNRLGKILRINPDGTIPGDNPTSFYGIAGTTSGVNRSIWAVGLRNPYTFSFQPGTGRMFINDVGQGAWEEINDGIYDGIKGSNYGWPTTEGPTTNPDFRSPLSYYNHSQGCAITGGAFYNPPTVQFPATFVGDYFFADYCGDWIRKLDIGTGTVSDFATSLSSPVDIQVASDGSLYFLERGPAGNSGSVYRITYASSTPPPTITRQPISQSVAVGQSVTFSVSATGSDPLLYQWQRNSVDIPNATTSSYTLASAQSSDNGAQFRVRVSNPGGPTLSDQATLTVTSGPTSIAFVGTIASATVSKSGNASIPITVPAGGSVAAGHAVVVSVSAGTFAGEVGCRDSRGNKYSVDADIRGTGRVFVCSSRNIPVALAAGDTITATYPGFSGISAATAAEYSGVFNVGPSATKSGNGTTPGVMNVSASTGELLVGAVGFNATPTFSPCPGFARAGEAAGGAGSGRKVVAAEYQVAATTTSYNVCGTLTAPRPWQAVAVVYRTCSVCPFGALSSPGSVERARRDEGR
jgi:glucose/arabinose dehydrogenase